MDRGARALEKDLCCPREGPRWRETTQRHQSSKAKGLTTSPVGMPVLSHSRKGASKSSKGRRTKRNRGTRKGILDDLRAG
jgi:hypothetical protein